MRKTILLSLLMSTVSLALSGQVKPSWTNASVRDADFPSRAFFTGFTQGTVRAGETVEEAKQRLLRDAQGLLTEGIRVTVRSEVASQTISTRTDQNEQIDAIFDATVETVADAEIVGINFEPPFHDPSSGIVYAFVWVNRFELIGYYRANLNMNLTQAEGLLQTARDLEESGENARARSQGEAVVPLLARVRQLQDMLTAIDVNSTSETLQQPRTELLHNQLVQTLVRLAQSVYVHIESIEDNFSQPSTIIINQLKSELATMGCSFTDDPEQAHFLIRIMATTRLHGVTHGLTVCFADVTVSLFDVRRNRSVFQDEFSQRGVHSSQETAGRRALEGVASVIAERISPWFE